MIILYFALLQKDKNSSLVLTLALTFSFPILILTIYSKPNRNGSVNPKKTSFWRTAKIFQELGDSTNLPVNVVIYKKKGACILQEFVEITV